ncbi:MAG: hypothetical protein GY768_23805 [Planctomycetaceae bacterium]|nr:hypothetical protein [Planctomycetaceae bacterium]
MNKVSRKARNEVASLKDIWSSKGDALWAATAILEKHGYAPECTMANETFGDAGRTSLEIEGTNAMLVLSWYRISDTKWEVIKYVS